MPDASLVAKWYAPAEPGREHALVFREALLAGGLRLTAPEHLKVEVARVVQLAVRDKHYTLHQGLGELSAFLRLPIYYVSNDVLLEEAFRLSTRYQIALYDALYLGLADALTIPFVTADRRFANLAARRVLPLVTWFEEVTA